MSIYFQLKCTECGKDYECLDSRSQHCYGCSKKRVNILIPKDYERKLLLETTVAGIESMDVDERAGFMSELEEHFCRHCGIKQPEFGICQCWNDE